MHILITGATGVVGRRAVGELLGAGHRVAGSRALRVALECSRTSAPEPWRRTFSTRPPWRRRSRARTSSSISSRTFRPQTGWPDPVRGRRTTGSAARRLHSSHSRRTSPAWSASCRSRSPSCTPTAGTPGWTRTRRSTPGPRLRRRSPPRPTPPSSSRATRSSCASGSSSAPTATSPRPTSRARAARELRRASAHAPRTGPLLAG